jgi:hypothetical protein
MERIKDAKGQTGSKKKDNVNEQASINIQKATERDWKGHLLLLVAFHHNARNGDEQATFLSRYYSQSSSGRKNEINALHLEDWVRRSCPTHNLVSSPFMKKSTGFKGQYCFNSNERHYNRHSAKLKKSR